MDEMRREDVDWRHGRAPLHVYYAGDDVLEIANKAFLMFIEANALAREAFPSIAVMEREVIDATLGLLNAPKNAAGSFTSGGTESILLALKAARDWSVQNRNIDGWPEIVMPRTAHPAFDKGAHFLGIKPVRVAMGADYRADAALMAAAINDRTIMLVASAPSFPYGLVDEVYKIAETAIERNVWLHVDACIGGFLAPFVHKLGYSVPDFDFRIPGVRSISADLHKYGYAAKGASTILYASVEFYEYQLTEFANWPKGKYQTPSLSGTRSGGAIASAWAVLNYLGERGYLSIALRVMQTRQKLIDGIRAMPELTIVGEPHLATFSFTSETIDIFAVANELAQMGWYISRISDPHGIHQMVNLAHEPIVQEYLDDLERAVKRVRKLSLRAENQDVVAY
jgi:glutamate/tyrosine decarboxylase-like PLP-dependent enzyme